LRGEPGKLRGNVIRYIANVVPIEITAQIAASAAELRVISRGGDSIHLATALLLTPQPFTFITHDRQQAAGAKALGFTVFDPVSDDPNCPPVG
jgi:hypothetical protein